MENSVTSNETLPSNEERLMALLSHLSLVIGGILLPLIIWATQKDKSQFVRFHSLQSIFFHLSLAVVIIFVVMIFVIVMIASGIGFGSMDSSGSSELPVFFMVLIFAFYAFIILFVFAAIGYSIYVALKAYKGELVRIIFIGNIIYRKVYGQS